MVRMLAVAVLTTVRGRHHRAQLPPLPNVNSNVNRCSHCSPPFPEYYGSMFLRSRSLPNSSNNNLASTHYCVYASLKEEDISVK